MHALLHRATVKGSIGAVAAALLVALLAAVAPRQADARIAADFTWSIAPRFGADLNSDGLPNDPRNTGALVAANAYQVTFNACLLANAVIALPSFRWSIDGGTTIDRGALCTLTRTLTRGSHSVRLTLGDNSWITRTITVRDLLVVSIGDSFASGEGAPDEAFGPRLSGVVAARWQNTRCHRSSRAAPAVAARAIEDSDPHSVVTFVHVACSGAGIETGILNPYRGLVPGTATTDLPSQVQQVFNIVGSRAINALIVGAGANDVGFAGLVKNCILQRFCNALDESAPVEPAVGQVRTALEFLCGTLTAAGTACNEFVQKLDADDQSSATLFAERRPRLAGSYDELADAIVGSRVGGGLGTPLNRVLLTPYHDPTRASDGAPCDPSDYPLAPDRVLPGLTAGEFAWAAGVVTQLNGSIASADNAHPWTRVPGIPQAFSTHGYCASVPWVHRLTGTFLHQGDVFGLVHPTRTGHARVADLIENELADLLDVP